MLSTSKSKLGSTLPALEIIRPSALYLPSQFLLLCVTIFNLSCLTPNTLSYTKSLNDVLLLNTTACSTNSVCNKHPVNVVPAGGVIVILLSSLVIPQLEILIRLLLSSTKEYCSLMLFVISAILPLVLSNITSFAIGLSIIESLLAWFSVVQNKYRLPASSQSLTAPRPESKSPKLKPDAI